jgi:pimeloyl-ACP methyl ester carboxylesterase
MGIWRRIEERLFSPAVSERSDNSCFEEGSRAARTLTLTILTVVAVASWAVADAAAQPMTLRYQLKPGDHLVYRERLVREVVSQESATQTRTEWITHVLVVEPGLGHFVVGFQRNRTSAELLLYSEKGRDRTRAERPAFDERMRGRRPSFAETNGLGPAGSATLPWSVAREWRSSLLPGPREIEPVPHNAITIGAAWTGTGPLPFRMGAARCKDRTDADCVLLEGTADVGRLQIWFSREHGIASKISLDTDYPTPLGAHQHEQLTFEIVERRRGESLEQWLETADLREGALAALQIAPTLPVPADRFYRLLAVDDPEVQRGTLAVAWRRGLDPPPADVLSRLLGSENPRVRTLATLLAGRVATPAGLALVERAGKDADWFVRAASTRAGGDVASLGRPDATGAGVQVGRGCEAKVEQWRRERSTGWQPVGATLRAMTAEGFEGWPYVVRVPDDYTGDRPVPLVVYLSGGPGYAIQAAQLTDSTFADTGYLVVFPHAGGMWWEGRPRQMVRALLDQVMRRFNVDGNRVFLAGFSNGGTGALYYAMLWPDYFAAVVPSMAAAVGDAATRGAFPSALASIPVLLLHGAKDSIIPASESRENQKRLERAGRAAPLEVALLEGRDHDIWLGADQGRTLRFLAGRERDPFPRALTIEMADLTYPRHYWVEIVAKERGVARVEARVASDDTIDITTRNVRRLRLLLRPELLPWSGPLVVRLNGREVFRSLLAEDCELFARSLVERSDSGIAYSAAIDLDVTRPSPQPDSQAGRRTR